MSTKPFTLTATKNAKFQFQIEGDDTVYELPLMQDIETGAMLKYQAAIKAFTKKTGSEDAMGSALAAHKELLDQYAPGVFDRITLEQLGMLLEAWSQASTVTLGES